ncbi:hypothetical protein AKO1_002967 [Acrasis kona]|uniref:BTB domain-containing protein n=1 Tax=Acrasis kona TaxID=1008807 RepID=A0AAW2Z6C7_9EUKA
MAFICEDKKIDFVDIFNHLFEQEQSNKGFDVKFKFDDGSVLLANGKILCLRCDFYKTMFNSSFKESQPPYEVDEESDPRLFKEFIRYLYCGKVCIDTVEDLILLYPIAEAKCHSSLLLWLSHTIEEHTTTENACKLLHLLWENSDRTTECFKSTYNSIKNKILLNIDSLKEKRICEFKNMELLTDVLKNQKYKDQNELFELVMVWIDNSVPSPEKRSAKRRRLQPLMATIDFKSMKSWYFTDKVIPLNVLEQSILKSIFFKFNVDAIGVSVEQIQEAKWRCVIPFDAPKTASHLHFNYNSRPFSIEYIKIETEHNQYVGLYLRNDGTTEKIEVTFTIIHTSSDDKLQLRENFTSAFNQTNKGWGKQKAFAKTLVDMNKEGYVFNKFLVFEVSIELKKPE